MVTYVQILDGKGANYAWYFEDEYKYRKQVDAYIKTRGPVHKILALGAGLGVGRRVRQSLSPACTLLKSGSPQGMSN